MGRRLSWAALDALVHRCPQCGGWVLPAEHMAAGHVCVRRAVILERVWERG